MRRLPPLDALRAFEAVARHLSFTRAADEVHVTQGAVSHRIRALEAELGTRLFRRLTRRLELTDEGLALAAAVRRGLDEIAGGVAAIERGPASGGPLGVSVLPSFASRWLVPRLAGLRARYPGIEVRVLAESGHADLRGGEADVAVRFGRGRYPGLHVEFLMADSVVPVCSPSLLREHGGPPDGPAALMRLPLLHDSVAEANGSSGETWRSWLAHVGRPDLPCEAGQRISDAVLAIEAAAAGLGVALTRTSLLGDDLASGRLVTPLPLAAPTAFSYWLVCLPETCAAPCLTTFRAWLHEEAQAFRDGVAAAPPAGRI